MTYRRSSNRSRRLAGALAVVVLLAAPAVTPGARDPLRRCGARKLSQAAKACDRVLDVWARWARSQRPGPREARIDRVLARLAERWRRAERGTANDCAERTAGAADTAARLRKAAGDTVERVMGGALDLAGNSRHRRCTARLLRVLARACRRALEAEGAWVETRDAARREQALAGVRRRLIGRSARLLGPACPAGLTADEAADSLAELRSGIAGDASVATLQELAGIAGIPIGSAAEVEFVDADPDYVPTLTREFDSLTPQSALKWGVIHPAPDTYDFVPADRMMALAEAHGMRVRGHTLVWGRAVDPRNPDYVAGAAGASELRALMADHIRTVMGRYAGRVQVWDVVNEPLHFLGNAGDTDGLDDNVFLRLLGPDYIADALHLAHAAAPDARLFINENVVLRPGPKQDRLVLLVQDLRARGAPLHGLGLQGHVSFLPGFNRPTRGEIEAALERFGQLGLDLEITELNVHRWDADGDRSAHLESQRTQYREVVAACVSAPACRAVTVWLFTDRYPTTMEQRVGLDLSPLIFDDEYRRKPAYFGVRAGLLSR